MTRSFLTLICNIEPWEVTFTASDFGVDYSKFLENMIIGSIASSINVEIVKKIYSALLSQRRVVNE